METQNLVISFDYSWPKTLPMSSVGSWNSTTDTHLSPEVQQIFKLRIVQKQDNFLPGRQTFNTFKNRKKNPKFLFSTISSRFLYVYLFGLGTFDTKFVSRDHILGELYLVGKFLTTIISPDSVQSSSKINFVN